MYTVTEWLVCGSTTIVAGNGTSCAVNVACVHKGSGTP